MRAGIVENLDELNIEFVHLLASLVSCQLFNVG